MQSIEKAATKALVLDSLGIHKPITRITEALETLHLFQVDSVNVFQRAHLMPAFSRMGPYSLEEFERIAFGAGQTPELREYWDPYQIQITYSKNTNSNTFSVLCSRERERERNGETKKEEREVKTRKQAREEHVSKESGLLVNLGGKLLEERLEGHGGVGLGVPDVKEQHHLAQRQPLLLHQQQPELIDQLRQGN